MELGVSLYDKIQNRRVVACGGSFYFLSVDSLPENTIFAASFVIVK